MKMDKPQSFNRYTYAHNDPVNYLDPSGLCLWVEYMDSVTERTWWEAYLCGSGDGPGEVGTTSPRRGPADRPQNPTPEQKAATRAGELLKKDKCSNFIAELISITAYVAGQPWSGQITPNLGPLIDVNGNPIPSYGANYGLNEYMTALAAGRVTASGGSGRSGDVITYGTTTNNSTISWNREF
jgi:hypothetical protein